MELTDNINRQFYTVIQLSKNMFIDNDGTMVCKNAVLGKAGSQRYSARELGLDSNEIIVIHRPEIEVFDEQSLSSLKGKALTLLHPQEDVSIDNYKDLSKGIVLDVHRQGNLIIGDIKVTDREVIDLIKNKEMVELSLGYDTKLMRDGDKLIQTEIVYNHVALVPKGRAEVARLIDEMAQSQTIRDKQFDEGELTMEVKEQNTFLSKMLIAMGLKKADLTSLVDEYPDDTADTDDAEETETPEIDVALEDGKDKPDPKEETKDVEDSKDEDEDEDEDKNEEETPKKETKTKTKDAEQEEDGKEGEDDMEMKEMLAQMRQELKDELLTEFEAKYNPEDNSALADFKNLSFKDGTVEEYKFDAEYQKMLDEINPSNYDNYEEDIKVLKRHQKDTTKQGFSKLADEAFEGSNE